MVDAVFRSTSIVIVTGDLTRQDVDAIVNAANEGLRGGGGVDGAIHRAGGRSIMTECDAIRAKQGGCPTGTAVITTGGNLPARYVIHTVGPIWNDASADQCDDLLASAYRSSLSLAAEHELRTIAFPSISTGIYGFPIRRAAPLVLSTVREFIESSDETQFDEVRFVLFSDNDTAVYRQALAALSAS